MERVQLIAVAVMVAALALFGVGYVVDGGRVRGGDGALGVAAGDGTRAAVGIANHGSETRGGSRRGGAGGLLPEERRGKRGGSGADADGGAAEVIAGARRGGAALGRSGSGRGTDGADGALASELLAARTGTLPRAGGGAAAPHHPAQSVDEPAPDEARRDPGGVLLSIPLQGSIDPAQGGDPTQADGVVVDRDAVEFTEQAQYTLPAAGHVDGAMGTIAFDIQPHWAGSDETNNSLLQIRDEHRWENNLQIVKNYNALRFIIIDSSGVETNVNVYIDGWQPNQVHRVTATWGEALMALYVDGQPVGQTTLPNDLVFRDSTPIHVGSDFPGSQYVGANGRISNLTIYGRPLAADEIH
ncbi:LamG domain-containing protein [bacterium]|nr:LamG domain-containing protein [bacterium]